jgi:hypothetical protein
MTDLLLKVPSPAPVTWHFSATAVAATPSSITASTAW